MKFFDSVLLVLEYNGVNKDCRGYFIEYISAEACIVLFNECHCHGEIKFTKTVDGYGLDEFYRKLTA